ncbi:MAG: 16S rRNA (guanine(966)-N(2))-methyltransferase RsmD [Helicobacteraceae bacterium]|nr:16S rRNA (guanine(966)-N(2))-methyltransferase RsmD [Helicobacteraceae bacterium]
MTSKFTKQIIAGEFKGKALKVPSKVTTRSSKTIVLESFFNTIQFEVCDAIFVEVFSGSGSIGLEALSRGASKVIFMEQDRDALKILKENISNLAPSKCEVYSGDSFVNIKNVIATLKEEVENVYFYIDPPFPIREGKEEIYNQTTSLIKSIPSNIVKLIIVEHMSDQNFSDSLGEFTKKKTKKFGKTSLSYYVSKDEDY